MGGVIANSKNQFDTWMIEKNEDYLRYIELWILLKFYQIGCLKIELFKGPETFAIALGSASNKCKTNLEKVNLLSYFWCYW